jgi:hypothetical protein
VAKKYGIAMRSPYSNSYSLIRAAGWVVRKLSSVETKPDNYVDYYLTKAELVDRTRLSPSQRLLLQNDAHLNEGPLYMATVCSLLPEKKEVREREVFVNAEHLEEMGLKKLPTDTAPVGDGKSVLLSKRLGIEALGQFWWNMRPRTQRLSVGRGNEFTEASINMILKKHSKRVNRSPIIGYVGRKEKLEL